MVRLPVLTYREIVLKKKSALDLAFQLLLHCIFVPDLVTFLMLGSSKLVPKTNNDQLLKNIWPRACPTRPHPFVHFGLLRCRRLLVSTSSKSFYKNRSGFDIFFFSYNERAEIVLEANGVDLPQHLNINTHNNRFITYKIEENNWLFTAVSQYPDKTEISNSLYLNSKISRERSIDHCVIVKRVRTKKNNV